MAIGATITGFLTGTKVTLSVSYALASGSGGHGGNGGNVFVDLRGLKTVGGAGFGGDGGDAYGHTFGGALALSQNRGTISFGNIAGGAGGAGTSSLTQGGGDAGDGGPGGKGQGGSVGAYVTGTINVGVLNMPTLYGIANGIGGNGGTGGDVNLDVQIGLPTMGWGGNAYGATFAGAVQVLDNWGGRGFRQRHGRCRQRGRLGHGPQFHQPG
jgi:hypothetical protein